MAQFAKHTLSVFSARVVGLVLGTAVSIIVARALGPDGKGVYAIVMLVVVLIVNLSSLGVSPATVYHVAQGHYPRPVILGNNILLALGLGSLGILISATIWVLFHTVLFSGISHHYFIVGVLFIPGKLLVEYLQRILLGSQNFRAFNALTIYQSVIPFLAMFVALQLFSTGIMGALVAGLVSLMLIDVIAFQVVLRICNGVSFRLHPGYLKAVLTYGSHVHLGSIVAFLNYRLDLLLINGFLNPAAVGFYSLGVGLVERLLLLSQSASLVLFPIVSAETDADHRNRLTPLVMRTVLGIMVLGSWLLFVASRWIIETLYTSAYLPALVPLQILIPGIVALGVSRVLSSDISGRGRPILNTYIGVGTLVTNIVLNLLWIPQFGISGAAWASTVSYGVNLVSRLVVYARLSGQSFSTILLPSRSDWQLYWHTARALYQRVAYRFSPQV